MVKTPIYNTQRQILNHSNCLLGVQFFFSSNGVIMCYLLAHYKDNVIFFQSKSIWYLLDDDMSYEIPAVNVKLVRDKRSLRTRGICHPLQGGEKWPNLVNHI